MEQRTSLFVLTGVSLAAACNENTTEYSLMATYQLSNLKLNNGTSGAQDYTDNLLSPTIIPDLKVLYSVCTTNVCFFNHVFTITLI